MLICTLTWASAGNGMTITNAKRMNPQSTFFMVLLLGEIIVTSFVFRPLPVEVSWPVELLSLGLPSPGLVLGPAVLPSPGLALGLGAVGPPSPGLVLVLGPALVELPSPEPEPVLVLVGLA